MLAKIAALAAYEARARLVEPVLAEYRKLNAPPSCGRPHYDDRPAYHPHSTTGAHVDRAVPYDHETPPVTAKRPFGFGQG